MKTFLHIAVVFVLSSICLCGCDPEVHNTTWKFSDGTKIKHKLNGRKGLLASHSAVNTYTWSVQVILLDSNGYRCGETWFESECELDVEAEKQ